jgi:hypothetical protein
LLYIHFEMVNKKEESEKRGKPKQIRFMTQEVIEIEEAAEKLGLDFSNFVRLAAKEKVIKTRKIK